MTVFDENELRIESSVSVVTQCEDKTMCSVTQIYDDTEKFLDYVSDRLRFDVAHGRKFMFVSQNITLDALIKHFFTNSCQDLVLYDVHYFYVEMQQFLQMFIKPYGESLARFLGTYECAPDATTVVLDFGSFQDSVFDFEAYLDFVQSLPPAPLILSALDAWLLSPSELSLALAYCPNIAINNRALRPAQSQAFNGLINTHAATNSALLQYTRSLAEAENGDLRRSIQSKIQLQQVNSRELIDREMPDIAWRVQDSDAQYHNSTRDLQAAAQIDLTSPRAARRIMSRRSIVNFKSLNYQGAEKSEEKDIEIKLE